jgi:LacI family xylobiose transport system transcriptional regulator
MAVESRRGRRRGELTIATVAGLAGVSVPTVSKVLNGRPGVALSTRQRVETLLREHGYRRPESAGPAPLLEVVFHAIEGHSAVEILRGVESVARRHELAVGFTEVRGRQTPGRSWLEQVLARRPAGVIAVYFEFPGRTGEQLSAGAIPVVALDPTGEPLHETPSVGAANWSGGLAATRHLIELGHRRIAAVGGPAGFLCARARLDGFRAAMDAAKVPVDPALVRIGQFRFDDGLELAAELLALPRRSRPTAIVAGNDLQALGVYEAARRAGLRIPEDLSVVGFDDLEFTQWTGPPMTTVRQPLAEMGAAAAELAVALAAGDQPPRTRIELATTLVIRQSTAPR